MTMPFALEWKFSVDVLAVLVAIIGLAIRVDRRITKTETMTERHERMLTTDDTPLPPWCAGYCRRGAFPIPESSRE
jgi:hypothetical protein